MLALVATHASAAQLRHVLLLHSFSHAYSPWSEYAASFREELIKRSSEPIDVLEVSLDDERLQNSEDQAPFVNYLDALLHGRSLDLVVPLGAPAALFTRQHRSLFASVPVLALGADVRRLLGAAATTNDTAVLVDLDLPAYVVNILQLLPETTEVAVVEGDTPTERYWVEEGRRAVQPFERRVHFTWFNGLSLVEMLKRAATMPPHSAIVWAGLNQDAAGVPHAGGRALAAMRQVANAPIFGDADYQLGGGIVGGRLVPTEELGQKGAAVALRIFKGEPAHDIQPIVLTLGPPTYDWRELRRWGIPESRLPHGSVIQYREPTVWARYRWQISFVVIVLLLETALISKLLYERRRRRLAELEAHQRVAELAQMNRRSTVGELSASIVHEMNQPLAAILLNSRAAARMLDAPDPNLTSLKEIVDDISQLDQRASEVIKRLRSLLAKAPLEAQDLDLNEVVREVFQFLSSQARVRDITLSTSLDPRVPPLKADRIQLQQVVLNLVMNGLEAIGGAATGERRIVGRTAVMPGGSSAEVVIEDSGPGIPAEKLTQIFEPFFTTKDGGMGMGLSIARTIVQSHGGQIEVENRRNGGATFRVRLPLGRHRVNSEETSIEVGQSVPVGQNVRRRPVASAGPT
ncbi:MAG: ATPase [Gammaproteobacteria bacterium]|nr:ATPase [Gammaproteobacteria bacterium]